MFTLLPPIVEPLVVVQLHKGWNVYLPSHHSGTVGCGSTTHRMKCLPCFPPQWNPWQGFNYTKDGMFTLLPTIVEPLVVVQLHKGWNVYFASPHSGTLGSGSTTQRMECLLCFPTQWNPWQWFNYTKDGMFTLLPTIVEPLVGVQLHKGWNVYLASHHIGTLGSGSTTQRMECLLCFPPQWIPWQWFNYTKDGMFTLLPTIVEPLVVVQLHKGWNVYLASHHSGSLGSGSTTQRMECLPVFPSLWNPWQWFNQTKDGMFTSLPTIVEPLVGFNYTKDGMFTCLPIIVEPLVVVQLHKGQNVYLASHHCGTLGSGSTPEQNHQSRLGVSRKGIENEFIIITQ